MREFGAAVYRVLGIYVIAASVMMVTSFLQALFSTRLSAISGMVISALLIAGTGVWIVNKAGALSERTWPDTPAPTIAITPDELFRILMAFLGVMFFARSIPILVNTFGTIIMFDPGSDRLPPHVYLGLWRTVASTFIQLVVAVYLFFWSDGLLYLWKRARGRTQAGW